MRFTKMHGLGNDFVVVDDRDGAPVDWHRLVPRLCDRRRGPGADGVLLVQRADDGCDLRMRLLNADGGEAEMCGNGIRCLARWASDRGLAGARVAWQTGAGTIATVLDGDRVTVDMGRPRFAPAEIPVTVDGPDALAVDLEAAGARFRVACVGMGNPHCVVVVDDLAGTAVERLGPALEGHELFPARTNVEFVQVMSRTRVRQRTFERGVGETEACGTGACAAVVALRRRGLVDGVVDVELRGGDLRIAWEPGGSVHMTGPAVEVYVGEVSSALLAGATAGGGR